MPSTRTEMRPVKYHYADSFACTYVISVAAASVAETVTYPLGNWTLVYCILINRLINFHSSFLFN